MITPVHRIRRGALALGAVFLIAVLAFHAVGYGWIEAIWYFVVTITGVGYSERSEHGSGVQILTIGVIVFGMSAAAYTFGGFLEMVVEGELDRALGRHRASRDIDRLNEHVIVCGFGRIGTTLSLAVGISAGRDAGHGEHRLVP